MKRETPWEIVVALASSEGNHTRRCVLRIDHQDVLIATRRPDFSRRQEDAQDELFVEAFGHRPPIPPDGFLAWSNAVAAMVREIQSSRGDS